MRYIPLARSGNLTPRATARLGSGLAVLAGLVLAGCSSTHSSAGTGTGSAKLASGCPAGGPGVTSALINLAVTVVDIHSGSLTNATVGVPSVQVQEQDWSLVADNINNSGGAACRKFALHFYNVNPLDPTGAQQSCLDIAASKPFMVLDLGALSDIGASNCIPAHQVSFASEYLTQDQLTKYAPYYLAIGDVQNDLIHNGVLGLNQLGYFSSSKGFTKLGVLYHNCNPALETAERQALTEAKVPDSKVVTYNLGCPAGLNDPPAALEQAVLSFKSGGVSDVTEVAVPDVGQFSQIAQQQNFKPQYVLVDDGFASTPATGQNAPNPSNLDGAVDIMSQGYGEQTTPGYKPSGGTAKCNAIFAAAGQATVYKQPDGFGGATCDYLWFAQAVAKHASSLQANALVAGLKSVGTIDFSFPDAPIDYGAAPAGATYGVSYWRAIDYHASCKCWQVPNPTFHAPFK